MTDTKRHTQDMARNWPSRKIGKYVIDYCSQCGAFMIMSCLKTGTKIKAPYSGPIPEDCPLEKAEMV